MYFMMFLPYKSKLLVNRMFHHVEEGGLVMYCLQVGLSSFGFGGTNAHAILAVQRSQERQGHSLTRQRSLFWLDFKKEHDGM